MSKKRQNEEKFYERLASINKYLHEKYDENGVLKTQKKALIKNQGFKTKNGDC